MKHIKLFENFDDDYSRYEVWEIESFQNQETEEIIDKISDDEIPTSHMQNHWKYKIYSVRRTTDNELFTVGDMIGTIFSNNPLGNIDWFHVSHEQMRILIKNLGIPLTDDLIVMNKVSETLENNKVYWLSEVPEVDDFGDKIEKSFIDGKTKQGPWAIMTPKSFKKHGVRFGLGWGQLYQLTDDGKWLKTDL